MKRHAKMKFYFSHLNYEMGLVQQADQTDLAEGAACFSLDYPSILCSQCRA
jgi:hypothetical protein